MVLMAVNYQVLVPGSFRLLFKGVFFKEPKKIVFEVAFSVILSFELLLLPYLVEDYGFFELVEPNFLNDEVIELVSPPKFERLQVPFSQEKLSLSIIMKVLSLFIL